MQGAGKVSVTLTDDMVRDLRAAVAAGDYGSTSEALRDAVRSWQRRRAEADERLSQLRARAARSLSDPRPSLGEAEITARLDALLDGDAI